MLMQNKRQPCTFVSSKSHQMKLLLSDSEKTNGFGQPKALYAVMKS